MILMVFGHLAQRHCATALCCASPRSLAGCPSDGWDAHVTTLISGATAPQIPKKVGKSWENHRKRWENHRKIMENNEKYGKIS